MTEFKEFPKMSRLSRECIISEKIDGTNASINIISEVTDPEPDETNIIAKVDGFNIRAGSRTKWITPKDDNYGFANWVLKNAKELVKLGEGTHFGEYWGQGIQRKYGLNEKRFSLFNTIHWCLNGATPQQTNSSGGMQKELPKCVGLVPVLYKGIFTTQAVEGALENLKKNGSVAAPGFMNPEGVVVFHIAAGIGFKKTLEKDEMPKSLA